MAVKVVGVAGSTDVLEWSVMANDMVPAGVAYGLTVRPGSGTRELLVDAGRSYQAGTNFLNSAVVTVTVPANTSGAPRIDAVVADVDWISSSGGILTEDAAGTVTVVPGTAATNPLAPALTQSPADRWMTPLAYVQVASGAGSFTTGNITDARPLIDSGWASQWFIYNGWSNFGQGYATASYRRIGNRVFLRGLLGGGTTGQSLTLPAGYIPPAAVLLSTIASNGPARVDVATNGGVSLFPPTGATWISLNGLSFFTD